MQVCISGTNSECKAQSAAHAAWLGVHKDSCGTLAQLGWPSCSSGAGPMPTVWRHLPAVRLCVPPSLIPTCNPNRCRCAGHHAAAVARPVWQLRGAGALTVHGLHFFIGGDGFVRDHRQLRGAGKAAAGLHYCAAPPGHIRCGRRPVASRQVGAGGCRRRIGKHADASLRRGGRPTPSFVRDVVLLLLAPRGRKMHSAAHWLATIMAVC